MQVVKMIFFLCFWMLFYVIFHFYMNFSYDIFFYLNEFYMYLLLAYVKENFR